MITLATLRNLALKYKTSFDSKKKINFMANGLNRPALI